MKHTPGQRHATRCVVCRRLFLPPLGRPAHGRPVNTCDRCATAARDRAETTRVERQFAAAHAAAWKGGAIHLTDSDCWSGQSPLAALGDE